jgi:Na+-transporting methylmalonyl-CoA/oxaloacetate decarboxylase gamma subunit
MGDLNPGFHSWGWGGQITLYALVMVFLMLLVLMACLMGITALDARFTSKNASDEVDEEPSVEPDEPEPVTADADVAPAVAAPVVLEPAPAAAGDGFDATELASIAVALHTHFAASGEQPEAGVRTDVSDPTMLAALAIAIHTALAGQGATAGASETGTALSLNRWTAVGRGLQTHTWQRS